MKKTAIKNHDELIMPASLPWSHKMDLNPITLSFPGDLEEVFLDEFYKNSLKQVRISLLAGIFFYGLFGILDAHLVPQMKITLWYIRFAIVSPAFLVVILLSYSPRFKKYLQASLAAAMLVAGLGIITMIYFIPSPVSHSYYAGLILVFMWGYAFTRVRFLWATIAGWLIVVLYEIVAIYVTDTPFPVLLSNNFFFISANILGMFVCYTIEFYERANFFINFLLEHEQEKIKGANRRLEEIVERRTVQLLETNKNLKQEMKERQLSEKKRAELKSQLQQSQKMEAMGTLAGGIAHDFNNLLMGIQANISMVLSGMDSENPASKKLRTAETYISKSAELTRQLLGFAKGGKYEVKGTNLNKLLKKSSQMFGRTKKEITIYTNYYQDIWTVEVDQAQIEQVLLNLYVNSSQAMPDGGNMYIRTENVTLDWDYLKPFELKPGNYVKTSVTDTGIGMDKETQQKVFDPFFTTKEMDRGTGLGLASAYGIIKNHNGFIEVSSEINKGATFSFYLPQSEEKVMKEKKRSKKVLTGNEKILFVDDEDMIINETSELLETLGYSVLVATSGKEAIKIYQENNQKIDLVILDIIMPEMGGGEVYDNLKRINPQIKVLLSSGYSLDSSAANILERGCNGFIQKPFNLTQLSQKVREVVEKH